METSQKPIAQEGEAQKEKGLFLYNPYAKKTKSEPIVWVAHQTVSVRVGLSNAFPFDVEVSSMAIITDGGAFETFPCAVTVPANSSNFEVLVCGIPKEAGILWLRGLVISSFGLYHQHTFEQPPFVALILI